MRKLIIWALFDSGNGSYKKVADDIEEIDLYAVGLDRENKNDHFINLDLADYSSLFGEDKLFKELDKLPKPDLIIASPPCESWSTASGMANGNACWKQDTIENLWGEMKGSRFTVRDYKDYEDYKYYPHRQLMTRINGELTILNTIRIIEKYKPKYYIIENPAYGRIWDYIDNILGFDIKFENLTYYNNYGFKIKKPTKFCSNIYLDLKTVKIPNEISFGEVSGYNNRSNIPKDLVKDIFETLLEKENENV